MLDLDDQGRIPRPMLIAGLGVMAMLFVVGGIAQSGALDLTTGILRLVVVVGLLLGLLTRRIRHRTVELGAFAVCVLVGTNAQIGVADRSPEGAAIIALMTATVLMALGLIIAPDGWQQRILAFTAVVTLIPPLAAHGATEPVLFGTVVLHLLLMAGLLRVVEATARRARTAEDLAQTDPLTGLANRRGIEPHLAAAAADRRSSTLLLLDLDHFKQLNDTEGHDSGDAALQQVAALLRRGTRPEDHLCRWGGEEFLVLLTRAPVDLATDIADRLRGEIGRTTRVTTSIGVAGTVEGEDVTAWVRRADKALYRAKLGGRDRVEVDRHGRPRGRTEVGDRA